MINAVWMIIAPSHAKHHYPSREENLLVCDSYIDASYMIAFFYPIVLIIVCTVYAVLTRKIPEAFNESKHIGECFFICRKLSTDDSQKITYIHTCQIAHSIYAGLCWHVCHAIWQKNPFFGIPFGIIFGMPSDTYFWC
jgi:hypothetical protein